VVLCKGVATGVAEEGLFDVRGPVGSTGQLADRLPPIKDRESMAIVGDLLAGRSLCLGGGGTAMRAGATK